MNAEKITFDMLGESVNDLSKFKIHIIGDTIVDGLTYCSMVGGMTKTPTMSVRYEETKNFLGGAGIVAKHLNAAGSKTSFTTVIGDDNLKEFVKKDLQNTNINFKAIVDSSRPTTYKNAITVKDYRLIKIDTLDNRSISEKIIDKICKNISTIKTDCIIFSDFRHGIFNRDTIDKFIKSIPKNSLKVADSQVASRWGNILEFQNFDLITPNEREARFALGDQDSVIRPLAKELHKKAKCKNLILKCGDRGLITYRSHKKKRS